MGKWHIQWTIPDQYNLKLSKSIDECARMLELIVKFVNAWLDGPYPDVSFTTRVMAAAIELYSPQKVAIRARQWWASYSIKNTNPYFDTASKKMDVYNRESYAGATLDTNFPGLPANAKLYLQTRKKTPYKIVSKDANGEYESCLPDATKHDVFKDSILNRYGKASSTLKELKHREKFEHFISWKLSGKMATKHQKDALETYELLYLYSKRMAKQPGWNLPQILSRAGEY
jgi:hypothetical protein